MSPAGSRPGALIDYDVAVRMRDGAVLIADVYRPIGVGAAPTIVQRTPYGKSVPEHLNYSFNLLRAVRSGWNVVVQDVRGRGCSTGSFDPFRHETGDGYETLSWIAAQEWSDGAIAMVGGSYPGAAQWLAALGGHPNLRALAPAMTPDDYYDGWINDGGARRLGFHANWIYESLWAGLAQRAHVTAPRAEIRAELKGVLTAPGHTDFTPYGELAAPFLRTWSEHPTRDEYWASISPRDNLKHIAAPAFVIAGWFDVFGRGAINGFMKLRSDGTTAHVRAKTRLVVGPWTHGQFAGTFTDIDFGPDSTAQAIDLTGLQLRWFDHVVRGRAIDAVDDPAVRVFVMGADEWRTFDAWPPVTATPLELELRSDPATLSKDPQMPTGQRAITHDPSNPVPTLGGGTFLHGRHLALNAGPREQTATGDRPDILRYESGPLVEQMQIIGRVRVRLGVSCDQPDANVTAKLVIVIPDGKAWGLVDGVLRLSHRDGDEVPRPLEPGQVYSIGFTVGHTAVVVPAGARLRLDVAASNFPHIADTRSSADGDPATSARLRQVTIHTGGQHRSTLFVDTVPEDSRRNG
ncbi:MAG: CocE/NonD family hydrolase [Actinomycetota bacterium]|nr:CocE/NonD family hydrolase [Actinomycetota bacterium]